MPVDFLNGLRVASVSALPAASLNAGVILRQGGKLWYSDGSTWFDLAATGGGGGGSQEVYVQQTRPASAGPWMWWVTNPSGQIINLIVNDGA